MSLDLKKLYEEKVDDQPTRTIIDPMYSGYYTLKFVSVESISIYIILIRVGNEILIIVIEANIEDSTTNLYGFIFKSDLSSFDFNDVFLSRLYEISKYKNQAKIPIHHSYVYLVTEEEILESDLEQLLNNPNNNLKIRRTADNKSYINGLDFLVFDPIILVQDARPRQVSIIVQVYNKKFQCTLLDTESLNANIERSLFMIETIPSTELGSDVLLDPVELYGSVEYETSDDQPLEDLLTNTSRLIADADTFDIYTHVLAGSV
jgi:hypothetical protein